MAEKQPAPKKQSPKLSLKGSGFAVMVLGIVVSGVIALSPTLRILAEQQQEIAALQDQLEQAEADVLELEEQRERWSDPAYVETQARERLMFVYPGDITYLVIDDVSKGAQDQLQPASQTVIEAEVDWRKALLSSYLVAATTSRKAETVEVPAPELIPAPELEEQE